VATVEALTLGGRLRIRTCETDQRAQGLRDVAATTWRRLNQRRDHGWAQPRLSDYIEGELPRREERRLAEHQELCPDCDRLISMLHVLLTILPLLRLPPAAAFAIAERTTERVRAQIEEWG
jgi:hypothetical protein